MRKILPPLILSLLLSVAVTAYEQKEKIQVNWDGEWFPATILDLKAGKYLIRYDGYSSDADEWVDETRMRRAARPSPRIAARGARGSKSSYLKGVETMLSCAYHPGGRYLAAGSFYGTVKIIDTALFAVVGEVDLKRGKVTCLAYSADGSHYAAGCDDGAVQVRDHAGQGLRREIDGFSSVTGLALSSRGNLLAVSGSLGTNTDLNTVRLFDTPTGKMIIEVVRPVHYNTWYAQGLAFDTTGARLLVAVANAGKGVEMYDTATGRRLQKLPYAADINDVAFSPDGSLIAGAAGNGTIPVWTAAGRPHRTFTWGEDSTRRVVFSPDGKSLAAAGRGKGSPVRLYSLSDGKLLTSFGNDNPVGNALRFSPDGTRISVCYTVYGDAPETILLEEFRN